MRLKKHFWFRSKSGAAEQRDSAFRDLADNLSFCPDFWNPCPETQEMVRAFECLAARKPQFGRSRGANLKRMESLSGLKFSKKFMS
jgi:hypothetical protein